MLTLFDYPPSQNAWKIRQLLQHLQLPYRTQQASIFEGDGQRADYLRIGPTGKVPESHAFNIDPHSAADLP